MGEKKMDCGTYKFVNTLEVKGQIWYCSRGCELAGEHLPNQYSLHIYNLASDSFGVPIGYFPTLEDAKLYAAMHFKYDGSELAIFSTDHDSPRWTSF